MSLTTISQFKGIHDGKRLFILASGPSLGTHDLTCLQRRLVMGLNRSFLIYPSTYYHCCMDQRLFDLYPTEMKMTRYLFTIEDRPWGIPMKMLGAEGFSEDLSVGVYSGYTISYVALQVAMYLGFKEIVYVGLDLCHQGNNTHFFGHDFHSRNHPTSEFPKMKRMFEYAAPFISKAGMRIYNTSPVSELSCFEKIEFERAVKL